MISHFDEGLRILLQATYCNYILWNTKEEFLVLKESIFTLGNALKLKVEKIFKPD